MHCTRKVLYRFRCESALAAADRSDALARASRNTADARDAAVRLVTSSAFRYWVSALAAADLSAALEVGSDKTTPAIDATRPLVSLDISLSSSCPAN